MSLKLNMRLSMQDVNKINSLKKRHGFVQTSDLIRYLLTKELDSTGKTH